MTNSVVLVGRINNKLELQEKNGKKYMEIILEVPREYRNENNDYEIDYIKCILTNGIASNSYQYVKKGDIIGIKGRLQSNKERLEVIPDKITFLTSKQKEN